jgi:hypothetical protein
VNLLGDYYPITQTVTVGAIGSGSGVNNTPGTFTLNSGPRSFLVGPTLTVNLIGPLSIEADAVHRPIQQTTSVSIGSSFMSSGTSSLSTWQFPVLAKYEMPMPLAYHRLRPFAEVGPAFRQGGGATRDGVAAGGGVSVRAGMFAIAPTLRYMHWQADSTSRLRSNEFDLFLGVSF